mmetsp:Transcript_46165/g.98656  ORF Transcript_46165/g.98656 Transcript_46165/m.98656 type:complete len:227 (-) Transcript_46165:23-703(-)
MPQWRECSRRRPVLLWWAKASRTCLWHVTAPLARLWCSIVVDVALPLARWPVLQASPLGQRQFLTLGWSGSATAPQKRMRPLPATPARTVASRRLWRSRRTPRAQMVLPLVRPAPFWRRRTGAWSASGSAAAAARSSCLRRCFARAALAEKLRERLCSPGPARCVRFVISTSACWRAAEEVRASWCSMAPMAAPKSLGCACQHRGPQLASVLVGAASSSSEWAPVP